jgi:hypothetical protein
VARDYYIKAFASPDYSRLVFWEYEGGYDLDTKRGQLQNPPGAGLRRGRRGEEPLFGAIPSTPYAHMIDPRQQLHAPWEKPVRDDPSDQSRDAKGRPHPERDQGHVQSALSPGGKNVFIFTKTGVGAARLALPQACEDHSAFKDLSRVQTLLASEQMLVTSDGRHAVIGALEKERRAWYSADQDDGFCLLELSD